MDRLTNNTEMDTYQSLSHWIIQQSKKKKDSFNLFCTLFALTLLHWLMAV